MPAGRPSDYSEELGKEICMLIAEGLSVRRICEIEGMPAKRTIFRWLFEHEEFRHHYARAREAQTELYAHEILDIADESRIGEKVKTLSDGTQEIMTGDMVDRAKLQVDARKWLMSKLAPKKYGDLIKQEISGPDGGPVQAIISDKPLSAEEWAAKYGAEDNLGTARGTAKGSD